MEIILCAAIWFDDGKNHVHQPKNITSGFVVCGRRHHNCFATVASLVDLDKTQKEFKEKEQGFITSSDRFVDRTEAMRIALESGQVDAAQYGRPGMQLFSEDLY